MTAAELSLPFVVRQHPDADAIQAQASAWANGFHLPHRNDRQQFGMFMATVYPDAAAAALRWVADFTVWLFVLDDLCDEGQLGRDLAGMQALHTELLALFAGLPVARASALHRAAGDLAARLDTLQPGGSWHHRFLEDLADYCGGCQWEARNRIAGRVPPLAEYCARRRSTSSVYVYVDFVELTQGLLLATPDRDRVRQLRALTNDVVSWGNDIASLRKEVAAGDMHNLVLLLEYERGLDRAQALAAATAMHNAAVAEFVALRARLALHGELATYADGMQHWMAANARWGAETARYTNE